MKLLIIGALALTLSACNCTKAIEYVCDSSMKREMAAFVLKCSVENILSSCKTYAKELYCEVKDAAGTTGRSDRLGEEQKIDRLTP